MISITIEWALGKLSGPLPLDELWVCMHVYKLVGVLLHWNNMILYLHNSFMLRDSKGCTYTIISIFEKSLEAKGVLFSCLIMSDSLQPHGLQHTRLPCPSPSPRAHSNSCPLSWWCHPTVSSSVVPFPSHLQSFPASGSFPVSQLFVSGGESIGASASASVLPVNIQDWFPLGWTGVISLQSKGLSRVLSNTTVQKHQFFSTQPSLWSNITIFFSCTFLSFLHFIEV